MNHVSKKLRGFSEFCFMLRDPCFVTLGVHIRQGIDSRSVFHDFKMQMDAGGAADPASAALFGNGLTATYEIAGRYV